MTSRRRSNKKSVGKMSGNQQSLRQLHKDLEDLMELQRAQETKFVPEVKDVPRIRFAPDQIHNVELSYQTTTNLSTTAPNFGALAFSLASSSSYSGYTSCFDQYRIIQVNVKILPQGITNQGGNYIYTVIDYDDTNNLTSIGAALSYSTLKITPAGVVDERTISPKYATAAYGGSTFNSYSNTPNSVWIDSASPSVQYYGLKYYSPQAGAGSSVTFVITMMVQFRAQRSS